MLVIAFNFGWRKGELLGLRVKQVGLGQCLQASRVSWSAVP